MKTNDEAGRGTGARIDPPEITETAEQLAAVIHLEIPREEMQEAFPPAVHELLEVLDDQGVDPAGPVFAHHLRVDPDVFDFRVGFPIDEPIEEAGRVAPGRLPAATVARTVHRGAYDGLPGAWAELEAWIEENGHTPGSDAWERYVVDPGSDPDPSAWRTELNRPLAG
jgi:effector-binding domain-containing protein